MSTFSRSLIATAAGVALLGLSACSGGGSSNDGNDETSAAPTTAASGSGLASFDPCTFFNADELSSFGVATQSEDGTVVSFEPGCKWEGEKMILSLLKNADETVASYETSGSWDSYTKKTIGGRSAAVAVESGAAGQGGCTVLVDAGGGVAIYGVDGVLRDSVDACPEAEKIASQTASRLPE
ncbi:DUF3558 domain-containing protein [Saccharopolyspora sp. K220]|uniref:DUF3558 family protein n=1 Tax=Saccharopolyspora soli TaxID=2926618 RepID=UPI001F5AB18E|nr:DUF3558 family protein [Saccharopolyspora soli]MCI2417775.1 DUF3558 domain-containing protein [Saccharopolyspora soli]